MTESVIVSGAVIAIVNAVREYAENNDWKPLLYVAISGLVGGLAAQYGLEGYTGLSFVPGILAGVAGSGAYTIIRKMK